MIRFIVLLLAVSWLTAPAWAHSQSYGYLTLDGNTGVLAIAVRDVDLLTRLDGDGNGEITWGEAASRENEIGNTLLSGIGLSRGGQACVLTEAPLMTDTRGGETYLSLPFTSQCPAMGPIALSYDLLFAKDAQHRGIVSIRDGEAATANFIMSPEVRSVSLAPGEEGFARFATFIAHGAHHIWIGYDHILFLITLLLATVLGTRGQGLRSGLIEATKVVTAFTVSHSLTLGLAATGLLRIPTEITESLIALTIALAAANNIWPVVTSRVWLMALVFGLVHGLGFASVLADLGLPSGSLLVSLLAFNIGVELGQLAIVAVALPVIYVVAAPRLGWKSLPAANMAIIAIGLAWFSDRALGTALMPF